MTHNYKQANSANDMLSLQAVCRFGVAEKFGLDEKVTFEFLSKACGVNVTDLSRLVRHAMTNSIFREDEDGLVSHTAASKVLRENALLRNLMGILTEELFPGAPHVSITITFETSLFTGELSALTYYPDPRCAGQV